MITEWSNRITIQTKCMSRIIGRPLPKERFGEVNYVTKQKVGQFGGAERRIL